MELSAFVIEKIRSTGPISFQEFMEICLYHPDLGYYTSGQSHLGIDGDFYTSATLTPAFGMTLAKQIEEMWHHLGGEIFTIVEYGGGTGSLCHDILSQLKHNKPLYDQLHYRIVERSPLKELGEKEAFPEKVSWHRSINEFPAAPQGCVLSNELLDNFSVHRVIMQEELMEVFIDYQNGFIETLRPAKPELREYLDEIGVELPMGFQTEINLQAIAWIREAAQAIDRGYLLTIDYGYPAKELYKPSRSAGTLLSYYKHMITDDFFSHIGQQDITSHVNFSALSHWGGKNGWTDCGFTDQCHFLLSLGVQKAIIEVASQERDLVTAAKKVSWLNHILLMDLGSKLKVLIQEKGNCSKDLSGLHIAYPQR